MNKGGRLRLVNSFICPKPSPCAYEQSRLLRRLEPAGRVTQSQCPHDAHSACVKLNVGT